MVCRRRRLRGRFGSSNDERSFFLKVAKTFYGFLPILFRHLDDLVGRRTRSIETIQASMRCPFHGFQSVQFFNRGEHRFDLPDRPLKYNEQEGAAVAQKQRIGRVFMRPASSALSEIAERGWRRDHALHVEPATGNGLALAPWFPR